MAKLIVLIDIPNCTAAELSQELANDKADRSRTGWYSSQDENFILVDEAYLNRAKADDSFYRFTLVGVKE